MGKQIDMAGMRFGRILVLSKNSVRHTPNGSSRTMWNCLCDCGNAKVIDGRLLRVGITKSCGCLKKEVAAKRMTKHGGTNTRLHGVWMGMRSRCNIHSDASYSRYGGAGIEVCKEWDDFNVFKNWAIENGYVESLTIDRIDNNRGYFPENCRWVDMKAQCNNRTSNVLISVNGETHNATEWSKITGISVYTILTRVHSGMPHEYVLSHDDLRINKRE